MILSMLAHAKEHTTSFIAAAVSGAAAITAWQAQLEWGMRIGASAVAIIAGSLTIYDWLKKRRG